MKDESGQVLIEFNLSLLLILLPLLFGVFLWFHLEWNRSKCAYESFFRARRELIQTQKSVHYLQVCAEIKETIHLEPLEELDQNKGPLHPSDLIKEVSQLSAQASHLLHSLQE